ncbi:MAG: hypothetical protein KKE02_23940 [Alphaproteobacteria bacterium]|nr:hypothetical protein [Alphaproteobacteria bacterium]MBU1516577.1 hypothetical protein [Alphaproteobacteria bacterium]MBU2094334.1 hypothetical protein [Alphaproteobacteria bacterium]MBU2154089.1 hypothetical protein [Alphaproteobacteria bacterium]MBU2307504.1 hypothetical protein [Alphaproteobacteria bacterium]
MRPLITMLVAASLAGCATLKAETVSSCHGARRPANPYGSVLAPVAEAAPATVAPATGGCGGPRS